MRIVLLISLSLVVALVGWSAVGAEDGFYVIPAMRGEYAPVPKTGQTTPYATRDDGDLQKGVAWPSPRFTDNTNGTVTDNLTGLVWLKNANCIATHYPGFDNDYTSGDGAVTWAHALDFVAGINDGTYPLCGAGYSDWRVPNVRELLSLIDYKFYNFALSNRLGTGNWVEGDPFQSVQTRTYWSSTTRANSSEYALTLYYVDGLVYAVDKPNDGCVWPVRGGP